MAGKTIAFNAKVNQALPFLNHFLSAFGDFIGFEYLGSRTILPAAGVDGGLTATGTLQTDALELNYRNSRFTTTAAGTGAVLPFSEAGMQIIVVNSGANALLVYPATGEVINALAANTAFSVAANSSGQFTCVTKGVWNSII
jgi:hypothetical protein